MRHLMSPLDFSTEELEELMDLADDIGCTRKNMPKAAKEKNWLPVSMNRAPGPV